MRPEQTLPPDLVEAEIAVIGGLLVDGSAISKISDFLTPDDFTTAWCSKTYGAAHSLHGDGRRVDEVTISTRLRELGHWDESLRDRLDDAMQAVPSAADIEDYARDVARSSCRRRALHAIDLMHEQLISGDAASLQFSLDDLGDLLERARQACDVLPSSKGKRWRERILEAFQTASALAAETTEGPDWIAKPWIASGTITLVDGLPKSAGKTTFLVNLASRILKGEPFLDEPTKQTSVVFLTEEPRSPFAAAIRRAGLEDRQDLHVLHRYDIAGAPWPELVSTAVEFCGSVGAELLIIDTFPPFAGLRGDAENQAGAVLEAVDQLQAATQAGLGVILARHERKALGEPGSSGRGSNALTGAVETILTIRRAPGASTSVRKLACLSRFDEVPSELTIELGPDGFHTVGGSTTGDSQTKVLAVLCDADHAALTEREIVKATDLAVSTVNRHLNHLAAAGQLERIGQGGKADPYRYRLPRPVLSLHPSP